MEYATTLYFSLFLFLTFSAIWFALVSLKELQYRAALISITAAVLFSSILIFGVSLSNSLQLILSGFSILIGLIFPIPIGKITHITVHPASERVDERDMMFARASYRPGDDRYEQYYGDKPELKKTDDQIRQLPGLLENGGRFYDTKKSHEIDSIFSICSYYLDKVDGEISKGKFLSEPENASESVKHMTMSLGADDVGIAGSLWTENRRIVEVESIRRI